MLSNESFADLERRFEALPKGHPALPPYGIFKLANRQIWGNIAIGLGNRLSVFQNPLVDKITSYNEIDLTLPGQKPCAYYCCISAQDSSLEFLSSLFFSQLFTSLMDYGHRHGDHGRLPVTVNVCLEEFCNIGKLMDFKRVLKVDGKRHQRVDIHYNTIGLWVAPDPEELEREYLAYYKTMQKRRKKTA